MLFTSCLSIPRCGGGTEGVGRGRGGGEGKGRRGRKKREGGAREGEGEERGGRRWERGRFKVKNASQCPCEYTMICIHKTQLVLPNSFKCEGLMSEQQHIKITTGRVRYVCCRETPTVKHDYHIGSHNKYIAMMVLS